MEIVADRYVAGLWYSLLCAFVWSWGMGVEGSGEWEEGEGALLCRKCGHSVVDADYLNRISSIRSMRQRNDTIMGLPETLIQLFRNPAGESFEVITASKSDILKVGEAHPEDSWFPGFTWTIAVCPKCGQHLGWHFESLRLNPDTGEKEKEEFSGLVLDYLHSDDFSNTLTVVPKPKTY